MDIAVLMEIFVIAMAWILFGYKREKKATMVVLEFVMMSVVLGLGRYCITISMEGLEIGNGPHVILWAVAHGSVSAAYVMIFTKFRRRTKILTWIALYTSILDLTAIGGRVGYLLQHYGVIVNSGVVRILCYVFIIPIVILIRHFNFDRYMKVPHSGIALLGFGIVGSLSFSIFEGVLGFPAEMANISIFLFLAYSILLFTELVAIFALHTMCLEQMSLTQLQIEKQRLQSEREMTQISAETLEKLRFIRHDLKNQYAYMDILLAQKRYDELRDYFAGQIDRIEVLKFIDCGNRAMNIVWNMQYSRMKKEGIQLEHQIVIPPVLPFDEDDICSLVTNLLDNAQEECRRLKKEGQKDVKIRLEIHPHSSYLLIRCENTTNRTTLNYNGKGLVTTKKDSNLHGYGTKIISKIAEKYNGQVKFYLEDQKFIAIAMLDMMMEEYANGN